MTQMPASPASPPRPPRMPKWLLDAQVFLLRRNWMGKMGDQIMIIQTIGRKTGKQFAVPIGFVRDGEDIVGFTMSGGKSNWFQNATANPDSVILTIRGQDIPVTAHPITNDADYVSAFAVYSRHDPGTVKRFFKLSPDAPPEQVLRLRHEGSLQFMRFTRR